jgi:hypothetical protein
MTVLVKSIKSTCPVKYPTEKDHMPYSNLKLLDSRESWVSGTLSGCLEPRLVVWNPPGIVGVWNPGCLEPSGNAGCLEPPGNAGVWNPWVSGTPGFLETWVSGNAGCLEPPGNVGVWIPWCLEPLGVWIPPRESWVSGTALGSRGCLVPRESWVSGTWNPLEPSCQVSRRGSVLVSPDIWLIDPRKRTARVYCAPEKSTLIRPDHSPDGGDVLPSFVLPFGEFLDQGRRSPQTQVGSFPAMRRRPLAVSLNFARAGHVIVSPVYYSLEHYNCRLASKLAT